MLCRSVSICVLLIFSDQRTGRKYRVFDSFKKSENEAGENLGGLDPVIVSDRAFETLAKQHA